MLPGVKFVSPDSLDNARGKDNDGGGRKKSHSKRDKHRTRRRSSRRSGSSSSDDDLQRIEKRSQRGKKWYSSDEYSSSENGSPDGRSDRKKKKTRKSNNNIDDVEDGGHELKHGSKGRRKHQCHPRREYSSASPSTSEDADVSSQGKQEKIDIARKEMGLEWMLRPAETTDKNPAAIVPELPEDPAADEMLKPNPRELNPYLKNNGTGYPVDAEEETADRNNRASSSVVGDGGASWRLKALKRAKEQAAREGRKLEEVVGERWDSVGQLAVSAAVMN